VTVAKGRAKTSIAERPRAPLTLSRAALGAILYGGLSSGDAARLGWAHGEASTLASADALFATPPFFALDSY
jgi:hypothetical protein